MILLFWLKCVVEFADIWIMKVASSNFRLLIELKMCVTKATL